MKSSSMCGLKEGSSFGFLDWSLRC